MFLHSKKTKHPEKDIKVSAKVLKYPQFKMAAIFWNRKKFFFLKNVQSILLRYPVGQKFCWNRSISYRLGDTSNFKFYHFCQDFKNSKWLPFLGRGKISENWAEYLTCVPWGSKNSLKLLYLAWFRRFFLCCAILKCLPVTDIQGHYKLILSYMWITCEHYMNALCSH